MAEMDVEALFRNYSIRELREMEKQVRNNIETKKEDLRQMVGRRYRDIIEAADSIRDMKRMSEDIMDSIRTVQSGFDKLQQLQQQLITAQQRANLIGPTKLDPLLIRDSQLKLLLELPELIWELLDDDSACSLLPAVWCLLLAEHIEHGLLVQISDHESNIKALLDKQIDKISNLRRVVAQQNERLWQSVTLNMNADTLVDQFCANALLENVPICQVLTKLLSFRKDHLSTLSSDSTTSSREMTVQMAMTISNAVDVVYQLFVPNSKLNSSRFVHHLNQIIDGHWQPAIFTNFMEEQSRLFRTALFEDVRQFRPAYRYESKEIDADKLRLLCTDWLNESLDLGRREIARMITFLDGIDSLIVLRQNVIETLSKNSDLWSRSSTAVFGTEFSVYNFLIRDALIGRLKHLINEDIAAIFDHLSGDVDTDLHDNDQDSFWMETTADCRPVENMASDATTILTLRAKGIPQAVYSLCRRFDKNLDSLRLTLQKYLDMNQIGHSDSELLTTISRACSEAVIRFCDNLSKDAELIDDISTITKDIVERMVCRARVCLCLCELCPGLKSCLQLEDKTRNIDESDHSHHRGRHGDDDRDETWTAARTTLNNTAICCYYVWAEYSVSNAAEQVSLLESVEKFTNVLDWLQTAQEWQVIVIDEETESGAKVASEIRVPVQFSRHIHRYLTTLARMIGRQGAHRLPKLIRQKLVIRTWTTLLDAYKRLLEGTAIVAQKQAIQLLFDCRVVSQLFNNQTEINKLAFHVIENLETLIDPFDLDVLNVHLKRNITKAVFRSSSMYGSLLPTNRTSVLDGPKPPSLSSSSDFPQLMPIVFDISGRFILLPVVAPDVKTNVCP